MKDKNNAILNSRVSYQLNAWSKVDKEINVQEALDEIKSNKHSQIVNRLRKILNAGDEEAYKAHKKNLAGITFCATFDKDRKKTTLKNYNQIMVLDVDKLNDEELKNTKDCFLNDDFVFSFWESPSKKGVKGLIKLNINIALDNENIDNIHKSAFVKLTNYFLEKYNILLDPSGNDFTRLCFFSCDTELVEKNNFKEFEINESDRIAIKAPAKSKNSKVDYISNRDILFNPKDKNQPSDRYTMNVIVKFLIRKNLSITYSYSDWHKVGLAIANSFTFDIGEKYFSKLSAMDKDKFNPDDCKSFLINCYETKTGKINFDTIVYLANNLGYLSKKQRDKGSEAVDENLSQVSSS